MESLTEANAILAIELQESMPSAIFSRATPIGKNASQILARLDDIITSLQNKVESVELFSPAIFKFDDLVQIIPDTIPGVHSCHSVAFTGRIIELKCYGGWLYNIFVRCMCVQVLLPGPHVGGPQSAIIAGRGKIICAILLKLVFPLI